MTTKYTADHEWLRAEGDLVVVGITDYAQQQLGEVVFVELPDLERAVSQGEDVAVVESVKAAGDIKSPLAGTVVEINQSLDDAPEMVNEDPAGNGWLFKLKLNDQAAMDGLMDQAAYQQLLDSLD